MLSDCFSYSSSCNGGMSVLVSLTYLYLLNLMCLQWVYFPCSSEDAWQKGIIPGKRKTCVKNNDLLSACNICTETDLVVNHIRSFFWTWASFRYTVINILLSERNLIEICFSSFYCMYNKHLAKGAFSLKFKYPRIENWACWILREASAKIEQCCLTVID